MKTARRTEPTLQYYFDMDGVMADFVGGICQLFGQNPAAITAGWTNGKYGIDEQLGLTRDQMWDAVNKLGPSFWVGLEPMPALDLFMRLKKDGYKPLILSSPSRNADSAAGKVHWIRHHIGSEYRGYILCPRKHKPLLANNGRLLIDDHFGTCEEWVKRSGLAICPKRPWNPSTRTTFLYDGTEWEL